MATNEEDFFFDDQGNLIYFKGQECIKRHCARLKCHTSDPEERQILLPKTILKCFDFPKNVAINTVPFCLVHFHLRFREDIISGRIKEVNPEMLTRGTPKKRIKVKKGLCSETGQFAFKTVINKKLSSKQTSDLNPEWYDLLNLGVTSVHSALQSPVPTAAASKKSRPNEVPPAETNNSSEVPLTDILEEAIQQNLFSTTILNENRTVTPPVNSASVSNAATIIQFLPSPAPARVTEFGTR